MRRLRPSGARPARYPGNTVKAKEYAMGCLCNLLDNENLIWFVILALLILNCCCNG